MPSRASGVKDNGGGRIGGARADFVASLGRKVNDARDLVTVLEEDPSSKAAREELRRRLHALGAGARLLHFEAMTHSLQEALAVLDRGAQAGALREQDVGFVAQVLDDLPTLAWGDVPSREGAAREGSRTSEAAIRAAPATVVVVGDEALAAALSQGATGPGDGSRSGRLFECERTEDIDTALEFSRTYAPDVLLVDTDVPQAAQLVEALLDDPVSHPVPIVVVGSFRGPDELARFVALGAARTLAKPVSPELLRSACDEIVEAHDAHTVRVTLGEPTLEQLADRLAEELKRALVDSVDRPARSHRVPLGEGTEVLGALWGAIARVQEVVTQKTGGAIRFGGETPEGAIALAPTLHQDLPGADRLTGRGRGAAADVRLNGRRVVVADDDPGVTWFVSDLLRTAGCEVHEALDGLTALDLAFRVQPELVVSDILMPGLDGFALCRALRRDVALRDAPVILLSWKEDLLQRVRELGASAAAYMRKESGSRAILARVREVLRPRARIETRLRAEGEMRGRLDGLTPRVLLELVSLIRSDARIAVRDATYLYEIEVRAGALRRVTRTASDGGYRSGERALSSLLGVGAGRFVVTSSTEPIHGELSGTLSDQLARPIAMARAALTATTGPRTALVERIFFDEEALEEYLRATPEPTRTLIQRLSQGTAPRQLLLGGEASPSLIEDVLGDLAARGLIQGVRGPGGVDLLSPAFEAALAIQMGADRPRTSVPPNARPSAPVPARAAVIAPNVSIRKTSPAAGPDPTYEPLVVSEPPPAGAETDDAAPSSLEDAVMREISDRLAEPRTSVTGSDRAPIIRPSDLLMRRASDPDIGARMLAEAAELGRVFPSIPPDAVVPDATAHEELVGTTSGTRGPESPEPDGPAALAGGDPPAEPAEPTREASGPVADLPSPTPEPTVPSIPAMTPPPSPVAEPQPVSRPARGRWGALLACAALVSAAVGLSRPTGGPSPASSPASGTSTAAPAGSALLSPPAIPTPSAAEAPSASAGEDPPLGAEVPPGYGLIEIRAPAGSIVHVDGKSAGVGPAVSTPATPGYHEVRVRHGGRDFTQVIEVRTDKTTRVRSAQLP